MNIHIFGASGSGVTTLGQALSDKLKISYFDSDDYFWEKTQRPFTQKCDPVQRNTKIREDLDRADDWILGGSIINWGDHVFPVFDLIVFLYIHHELRMERLVKREFERYGNSLIENEERAEQYRKFMQWAGDYDHPTGKAGRTLAAHEAWMKNNQSVVLRIEGDTTVEQRLAMVVDKLDEIK